MMKKFGIQYSAVLPLIGLAFASPAAAQSLKGSPSSVLVMYSHAVQNDFEFFRTGAAVKAAVERGDLVFLPGNSDYETHDVSYPYAKAEAKLFVERLASQYRAKCGEKLVVTGATRPESMHLRNASEQSVHPTGMAIDLRKPSGVCLTWLQSTLLSLEKRGVLEATQERTPAHFHVAVFPTPYSGYVSALLRSAAADQPEGEAALEPYAVRRGDSLWRIAQKHDTSVKALQELNQLRTSTIHPGQVILVPVSSGS